ncbi:MAG: O-antigen ligase family protein [Planctomycetaceae bacterium]
MRRIASLDAARLHAPRNPVQAMLSAGGFKLALFVLAHVPLAVLMSRSAAISTAHALAVLLLGFAWGLRKQAPERVAFVAAYIAGAEVLWRMTKCDVFWEYGKYATSILFLGWMAITGSFRRSIVPLFYLLLLIPSISLTLSNTDPFLAKRMISFNLSGPLSLAVCAMFFGQVELTREQLNRFLITLLAPVLGISTLAFLGTAMADDLLFTKNSNFETSGGYGPNQVSAILGLAALLAFLLLSIQRHRAGMQLLLILGVVGFAAQAAFTFSRGGVYNCVAAALVGAVFLMRGGQHRGRVVILSVLVTILAYYVLFPRLDAFSGGQLAKRFEDTETSGRDAILRDDLAIWERNLILGVGPGMSRLNRITLHAPIVAHTEFSRLAAEHGIFGLLAAVVLVGLGLLRLAQAPTGWRQALAATLVAWSFIYMLHAAMRLVAPSLMLGLAMAKLLDETPHRGSRHGAVEDRDPLERRRSPPLRREPGA